MIFTVLHQGSGVADEGVIESVDLETGERKVLHRGGAYGRWVPSGHLVYVRENTLFAMPFDIDRMEATGSPSPMVQGVTTNSGNGGSQISFSSTGTLAYVSGVIGVPEYPVLRDGPAGRGLAVVGRARHLRLPEAVSRRPQAVADRASRRQLGCLGL